MPEPRPGRPGRAHRAGPPPGIVPTIAALVVSAPLAIGCAAGPATADRVAESEPTGEIARTGAADPDGTDALPAVRALPTPPAPTRPRRIGELGDPELLETSGLASAPRESRALWAVNDSGAGPVLHALTLQGAALGSVRLDVPAHDWEDLAAATLAGVPTLAVADTGDNRRRRERATIHLVAEPDLPDGPGAGDAAPVSPYATLRFGYEDGPQDVESLAWADGAFWLLSKAPPAGGEPSGSGVYRLDLPEATLREAIDARARGADPPRALARRVATLPARPATLATRLALSLAGVDLNHPTALDIDEARGIAWVLTYREVLRFDRRGDESWASALSRAGTPVHAHSLPQAEALAATPEGLVVFTSEGRGAPLIGLVAR